MSAQAPVSASSPSPGPVAGAGTPPPVAAPTAEVPDEPEAAPAVGPTASGNAPDETNVWPDEAAEAAFLAESRERGEPATASPAATREAAEEHTGNGRALPPLDELVKRIPPEARELLDELFRARFTAVRRIRKNELKA